jgi:hypothetical protein
MTKGKWCIHTWSVLGRRWLVHTHGAACRSGQEGAATLPPASSRCTCSPSPWAFCAWPQIDHHRNIGIHITEQYLLCILSSTSGGSNKLYSLYGLVIIETSMLTSQHGNNETISNYLLNKETKNTCVMASISIPMHNGFYLPDEAEQPGSPNTNITHLSTRSQGRDRKGKRNELPTRSSWAPRGTPAP